MVDTGVVTMSVPLLELISPSATLLSAYPVALSEFIVVFPLLMFQVAPLAVSITDANMIVDALVVKVPVIVSMPAVVSANDDAAEVLRVAPALMVTAPNCIEALPMVEVPAALKDNNPLEWVKTVGLFQTAPAKVKAVAPVPDGATNVPADAKRLPVITSDVAVVMVTVALALMVVIPVIVFVPVLVVTAPLVPPPTMRLPAAVQLYVDVASVVPSLTVTE